MNIHPVFVHFPVALLSIYAVLEMIRFNFASRQPYWFYLKAFTAIGGTLFSYAALYTGSMAEDVRRTGEITPGLSRMTMFRLIDTHSNWAVATAVIFSVISVLYIIEWVRKDAPLPHEMVQSQIWKMTLKINNVLLSAPIIIPLAIIGLIVITVTGSLGGAIVYGANADPIVHFVYNLAFKG